MEKKNIEKNAVWQMWTVGRRKEAIARLYLKNGTGNIIVNNKKIQDYFYMDNYLVPLIKKPLEMFHKENDYDLKATVNGGGFKSQAGAMVLAISRLLSKISSDYRPLLKQHKLLTRDSRSKERRKPGLLKARKRPPFVKR